MIYGNSKQQDSLQKWMTSTSSLLVLTGVPHLGKSSYAREKISEKVPDEDVHIMQSGVDGVRDARTFLSTNAISGDYRYLIIDDADSLLEPAQDALLKMIEEPSDGAKILLIAHEPGYMQPALTSRFRNVVRWLPLGISDMLTMSKESSLPEDAQAMKLSMGRPGIYHVISGDQSYRALYEQVSRAIRREDDLFIRPVPTLIEKLETGASSSRDAVVHVLYRVAVDNCSSKLVHHVLKFCKTLQSVTSANAEIHWQRMAASISNVV